MAEPHNAAAWLVDRHVADGGGDRVAIRCQGRETTYAQLLTELHRAQCALLDLGIGPGERVALVLNDDESFPAWFLGALRSGAVPVPLSTMLTGAELGPIVADAGATTVVLSDTYLSALGEIVAAAPAVKHAVVAGDLPADAEAIPEMSVSSWSSYTRTDEQPVADTTTESPAFWLYSSGTTGKPKGVMHVHSSVRATAETYADQVLGIGPDDRFLSVAKLFFAYGLGNSLTFPFSVGGTAILNPERPTPQAFRQLLEDEAPTLFFASPGFCAAMLDADIPSESLASVRATVTAGESLPADIQKRFTALSGSPVLDGIGSTELLHIFISNTMTSQTPGSSGVVVPGYVAELRDESGATVTEPDTPGFLHVQGPSAAVGYHERPEASAAAFVDGWVRTGDVYTRSADDTWTFLGRNNDMIKAGGIWVSPAEVEGTLIEHPDVLEVAVVGDRSADGLEEVVAFVVAAAGAEPDPEQLEEYCRSQMASFKRPRRILVVSQLPRTATGKVQRFALRDQLA